MALKNLLIMIKQQDKEIRSAIRKGRKEGYEQYSREAVVMQLRDLKKDDLPVVLVYVNESENMIVAAYPYMMALYLEEYDKLEMLKDLMKKWEGRHGYDYEAFDMLFFSNLDIDVDASDFQDHICHSPVEQMWIYKNMKYITEDDVHLLPLYRHTPIPNYSFEFLDLLCLYLEIVGDFVYFEKFDYHQYIDLGNPFVNVMDCIDKELLGNDGCFKKINVQKDIVQNNARADEIFWNFLFISAEEFEFEDTETILEAQRMFLETMGEEKPIDIYLLALEKGFFPKEILPKTIQYCDKTRKQKIKNLFLFWNQKQDCDYVRKAYRMLVGG